MKHRQLKVNDKIIKVYSLMDKWIKVFNPLYQFLSSGNSPYMLGVRMHSFIEITFSRSAKHSEL